MDQTERDKIKKLLGMLMPYAEQKRDELRPSPRLAYYTCADTANKLLRNQELWLRDCGLMNDSKEVIHGIELIEKYFTTDMKRAAFCDALDASHPGAALDALALYEEWKTNRSGKTYIMSFSCHAPATAPKEDRYGRLSMWREYGGKQGVALVFNIPLDAGVEGTNLFFSPVGYFDEIDEQMDAIVAKLKSEAPFLATVERQKLVYSIFMMLVAAAVSLKHPGFHEELEWRLLYLPTTYASKIVTEHKVTIEGVDQTIYKLTLPSLARAGMPGLNYNALVDQIIVGAIEHPEEIRRFMEDALRDMGVKNPEAKVLMSGIPFRFKKSERNS